MAEEIPGVHRGTPGIPGAADTFRHLAVAAAGTCRLAADSQGNRAGVVAGCSGKVPGWPRSLAPSVTHWLDQSWAQRSP